MPNPVKQVILKPVRIVRGHRRLLLSLAIGVVVIFLLPTSLRLSSRLLIGWDLGITIYLARALFVLGNFDLKGVRQRAASQDEGGLLILALTVAAAIASLAAIFAELGSVKGATDTGDKLYVALAIVTIMLSWFFIHFIFAFHYAHAYYGEGHGSNSGCLSFPEDKRPDYWDFVYFSFVVGMTFQVSDVQVTSKLMRRFVVAHGIVSFIYNVVILALVVNIGSQFIGTK
jgi:uncharacterized membrane protein